MAEAATQIGPREIVLVNPPAEVVREECYDRPHYPSIGIAYIGGYLETRLGVRSLIVDGKMERLSVDETVARIVSAHPRIVGFTAFTHMVNTAHRIALRVRELLPEAVLVLGGYHASFLPERSMQEFPGFDFLVVGEGEMAFADLVTAIRAGEREPRIHGVWYRNAAGEIVAGGRGDVPKTLDEQGFPAWHLFDAEAMKKYVKVLPVMSQRGCPFECNFCSRPYGRVVRRRSPAHVADELQRNIDVFGIGETGFYDETFTVNKKHVIGICNEILQRGLKVRWQATVHANTVDEPLVRMMKDAGCSGAGFGVESGDDDIIAAMKKGVNRERIKAATDIFRKVGLNFSTFFIIGHPGETAMTVWRSIRFAAELNANRPAFGVMVPYPGTEIWEMAVKGEGGYKKLSTNWDDYNKQLGNAVELERLSRRQMEMLQVLGYLYCFISNGRFRDAWAILSVHKVRIYHVLRKIVLGRMGSRSAQSGYIPEQI
jgi:radical SAM superfamily enzyme YgiQ (UPF0313 family)